MPAQIMGGVLKKQGRKLADSRPNVETKMPSSFAALRIFSGARRFGPHSRSFAALRMTGF
jgi:hypothetical protein